MQPSTDTFPFNLRVVEARGLYASRTDIADPFVVVKLKGLKHIFNSEKQSTEPQMNNENPVFNQDFLLHPKQTDNILVKIMDKNTPINRKLGTVLLPVSSYLNRGVVDSWFPIEAKTGRAGEVRLLINFGGQQFAGFRDYLSRANMNTSSIHSRDVNMASRPILPPSQTVPLATQPIHSGMQNLNLGAPVTTTVHADTVKNVVVARDTVVQERVRPVEEEIIQPVIHRERQQTEIHRVTQDIKEAQVLPTVYQEKTLAAEYRGDFNRERNFLAEENNTRSTLISSRDIDATRHTTVVNAPIVEETIKKTVIEVVQPVVHRDTTAPVIIRETLPIYEKIIEEPIIYNDVRTSATVNILPTMQQVQPTGYVQETVIKTTTVENGSFGAKGPYVANSTYNSAHQSF